MIKSIPYVVLVLGLIFRLFLTSGNNFIFHQDSGHQMVDVREMVVLRKPTLIGPVAGIEGLFSGPGWYYLVAFPFLISGGSPYAVIVTENLLWLIGGVFLIRVFRKSSVLSQTSIVAIWAGSNLSILYSMTINNPVPNLFLIPVFVYFYLQYIETERRVFSVLMWVMAGLFYQFEMAFGLIVPLAILVSFLVVKREILRRKETLLGIGIFLVSLLPQLIFDLKHNFILTKSVLSHISSGSNGTSYIEKFSSVLSNYYQMTNAIFLNNQQVTRVSLLFILIGLVVLWKKKILNKDQIGLTTFFLTILLGHLLAPIDVQVWHIAPAVVLILVLFGLLLARFQLLNQLTGVFVNLVCVALLVLSVLNLSQLYQSLRNSNDPSLLKYQLSAIDYVYNQSHGQNFKVYSYLPSVIDYPYQYLFWWYGQKKYGYLPEDYAYSPNKPPYIKDKERFSNGDNPADSGLTFLIEEPSDPQTIQLWENSFRGTNLVTETTVGPLTIQTRR